MGENWSILFNFLDLFNDIITDVNSGSSFSFVLSFFLRR